MAMVYKILDKSAWSAAVADGVFRGAAIDLADGYIHFSDASQVEETAAKYFANQHDLLLVAFDADALGDHLTWEASRGGALFPHLYDHLNPALALWAKPLPWKNGAHVFPPSWQG